MFKSIYPINCTMKLMVEIATLFPLKPEASTKMLDKFEESWHNKPNSPTLKTIRNDGKGASLLNAPANCVSRLFEIARREVKIKKLTPLAEALPHFFPQEFMHLAPIISIQNSQLQPVQSGAFAVLELNDAILDAWLPDNCEDNLPEEVKALFLEQYVFMNIDSGGYTSAGIVQRSPEAKYIL